MLRRTIIVLRYSRYAIPSLFISITICEVPPNSLSVYYQIFTPKANYYPLPLVYEVLYILLLYHILAPEKAPP